MLLRRTELLFPRVSFRGMADYPPGATFGPRTLIDYEFVWIVEGDVVWEADGVEYPAPAGTVLLARPGMRDGFRWDPRRRTRHGFFHFLLENHGAELPPPERWPMTRLLPDQDVLRSLFHHLDWLLDAQPPGWEELSTGMMRQALLAYISGAVSTIIEPMGEVHPVVLRAMAQVRSAWADGILRPLSLAGLARAVGVSRAHLARLFARELGAAPVETLRLMRLDRAASLLARTNLSIGVIADTCGFANAFHFSRLFHRQYGKSPRAFRRAVNAGMNMPAITLARIRVLSGRLWQRAGG